MNKPIFIGGMWSDFPKANVKITEGFAGAQGLSNLPSELNSISTIIDPVKLWYTVDEIIENTKKQSHHHGIVGWTNPQLQLVYEIERLRKELKLLQDKQDGIEYID